MILDDQRRGMVGTRVGPDVTLDDLLRQAALQRPDALALLDPPDRQRFTDGNPRRLTYAHADRVVSAIAGRLRRLGLGADAIVGLQIANTVESVLTLLGVLRAGLIAMPLPLLWRRAEALAAFGRIAPDALVVSGRIGGTDHYDLAMQVAAGTFRVRHVCGYGAPAPDGVVLLDDLFTAETLDPLPSLVDERDGAHAPGTHVAVITWDMTADGPIPVARNHSELVASALPVVLESRLGPGTVLLSTTTMSSFAGLAVAMTPWLLVGGTLVLHHPFDRNVLRTQIETVDALVVPGTLLAQLAESDLVPGGDAARVIGIWRAPERLVRASPWRATAVPMIDVQLFGEIGLIAASRTPGGRPVATPVGVLHAPRTPRGPVIAVETAVTPHGTVGLRGPMVPHASFPPGAERSGLPHLQVVAGGFVDTGHPCRRDGEIMVVTGPTTGIAAVGGYRFLLQDLQDLVDSVGEGSVAVLPDGLAGQRLAGTAADREAMRASLSRLGANPLLVDAFRRRSTAFAVR